MTEQDAREAITGRVVLNVFFTDSVPVRRLRRVRKEEYSHVLTGMAAAKFDEAVSWLPRGSYSLPLTSSGTTQPLVVAALAPLAGLEHGPTGLGLTPIVVEDRSGERYALCEQVGSGAYFMNEVRYARQLPPGANLVLSPVQTIPESPKNKVDRETYEAVSTRLVAAGMAAEGQIISSLPRGWWSQAGEPLGLGAKQTVKDRFMRHSKLLLITQRSARR